MRRKSNRSSNNQALRRAARLGLVLVALGAFNGCTHVKPWERGVLADPIMQPDRDLLGRAFAEHMWFSREATYGGRGVGGGGCGCN